MERIQEQQVQSVLTTGESCVRDVPVIMQFEFQQSKVFELNASQIQCANFLLCSRDGCPQCKLCRKQRFHGPGAVRGRRRCDHAATSSAVLVFRTVEVPLTSSSTHTVLWRVSHVFFKTVFSLCVFGLRPFGRRVPAFRGEFWGAFEGHQCLVVEGSGCTIRLRGCRHRHFVECSRPKQQQRYNLGRLRFNRRGASTPLWEVESCSLPSRWPNPIPAIPPYVVRTPHLHGAPTSEETVKL